MNPKFQNSEITKLKKELQNYQVLFEAIRIINSTLKVEDVLDKVMDLALDIVEAERGFLALFDRAGELHFPVIRNMEREEIDFNNRKFSTTILNRVLDEGKLISTDNAQSDFRFDALDSVVGLNLRKVICSPLTAKEQVIGAIYVDDRVMKESSTNQSLQLFEALAGHAAIAIENARLHAEVEKNQRIEQELRIATQIQNRLIPSKIPDLDQLDVYALMIPAKEVGGDYCDLLVKSDDDIIFSIGDVSGKGIPAGLLMAEARTIIRSLAVNENSPEKILVQANKILKPDMESYQFMTMLLAYWNGENLTWASAGHEPVIYYDVQSNESHLIRNRGQALGFFGDVSGRLEVKSLSLNSGDVFVSYTDGITDAESDKEERFGLRRLRSIVDGKHNLSAKKIGTSILREINVFTGGAELFDDITLLIIKKK